MAVTADVNTTPSDSRYTDNQDVLLALVSYLGLTHRKSRTPSTLSKYLGLDKEEIVEVLEGFPGIFRESISTSDEERSLGEHYYTLQLRYARRWMEDGDRENENDSREPQEPLDSSYLTALFGFIADMIEQERRLASQKESIQAQERWVRDNIAVQDRRTQDSIEAQEGWVTKTIEAQDKRTQDSIDAQNTRTQDSIEAQDRRTIAMLVGTIFAAGAAISSLIVTITRGLG